MQAKIDHGTFTAPELCRGIGMSQTTFELLNREGLVIGLVRPGGHGRHARYSFSCLSTLVMAGALDRVVEGFVMAGRIANGISQELAEQGKPFIPFGFPDLQLALSETKNAQMATGEDGTFCPYRTLEAAWRSGLVDADVSALNDYLLVIIDSEFVGETNWLGIKILMQNPANDCSVSPVLTYRSAGKGPVTVHPLRSMAEESHFCERLRNAESLVQLNLSLALRRAVVRIIKMREAA